jgi:hypothetical protein
MACLGGCHGMPWLALVGVLACLGEFLIRHLEGVPSFKSKVASGALVGAMACLGVCHGMPKRIGAAQIFFLPMPFAQSVFLSSL